MKIAATVYLSLGANLGDRIDNLERALARSARFGKLTELSRVYETEPWDVPDEQPPYLNMTAVLLTDVEPRRLARELKQIEFEMGRAPNTTDLPRPIDIDILLYDDIVLKSAELTIPHPEVAERAFVLAPLMDNAPDLIVPELEKSVRQLCAAADHSGVKTYKRQIKLNPNWS